MKSTGVETMFRLNGRWVHTPDEITDEELHDSEHIHGYPMTKQHMFDWLTWAARENAA